MYGRYVQASLAVVNTGTLHRSENPRRMNATTNVPRRYVYTFPVVAFLRRLFSERCNVPVLTQWFESRDSDEPEVLQDIRDGSMYRKRFLGGFKESKFNVAISICGDGVQKSRLSVKTVFPVAIRIESTCVEAKADQNLTHVAMLCPGDYRNIHLSLCFLAEELALLQQNGILVDVAGVGREKVRVCTLLVGGDCRAIQSICGKHRDPAIRYACPNCRIEGIRHAHRTIYVEEKERQLAYQPGDSTSGMFKEIPSLAHGVRDIEETIAICHAHNLKNVLVRIFEVHCDVGQARFTDKLRAAEGHRFPGNHYYYFIWLYNEYLFYNIKHFKISCHYQVIYTFS